MEEAWEFAALDMASRPAIPAAIKRAIREEAGYRCGVPTCRDKGPFDFEHIEPWAKVRKHELHNIILLCVSCHARVTRGEIDKSAIKTYKKNLAIFTGRYTLYEMRMLEALYKANKFKLVAPGMVVNTYQTKDGPEPQEYFYIMENSEFLHIEGLLADGYVQAAKHAQFDLGLGKFAIIASPGGLEFYERFYTGDDLEGQ